MFGLPLAFAAPAVLAALVGLGGALFPPARHAAARRARALFPPLRLLIGLDPNETRAGAHALADPGAAARRSAALIILAMAEPLWNSLAGLAGSGPLLVLVDDGWAGGADLRDKRVDYARSAIEAARARRSRRRDPAALAGRTRTSSPLDAREASRAGCARSRRSPTRRSARRRCRRSSAFSPREPKTDVLWIADGLELGGASAFAARLAALDATRVEVVTDGRRRARLAGADNDAGALDRAAHALRRRARRRQGAARALDAQGPRSRPAPFDFGADSATEARFDLPVELRNEITRVVIDGERSAGATWLVDERSRRRRVAIASGASADVAQPLLAPSYYLKRALAALRRRRAKARLVERSDRLAARAKSRRCSRSPT